MPKPIVAIVGRPNVGKSSLFNRIAKKHIAVIHDRPGVTRDRLYADVDWMDKCFTIADTGGMELAPEDSLIDRVKVQVEAAINEAEIVLFVVDAMTGMMPQDMDIANALRQMEKPIFVVVNKVDNERLRANAVEFYELGFDNHFFVSCTQNDGLSHLLDRVIFALPKTDVDATVASKAIKVAIVGRPNVGKSSLINRILGEERMIVDERPGTTHDAVNISFVHNHVAFELIDTAGMRRKSTIGDDLEQSTVQRAIRSIRQSDISWLVVDASRKIARQDKTIASYIARQGKACILVINKWDLIEKDNSTHNEFVESIYSQLSQLSYVPLLFVSAITGQRVTNLLNLSLDINYEYCTEVPTHELNDLLMRLKNEHQPPRAGKIRPALKYITQIKTRPPTFLIFARHSNKIPDHYEAYLINGIRKAFGFNGTPLRISYRSSNAKDGE